MQRRWTAVVGTMAIGLAAVVGCRDAGGDDRLHQLEARVGAVEKAAAASSAPAVHGATADVLSLERRLAALEQRMAAVEKAVSTPATPGGTGEMRLDQRRERRTRLRELTDEYRARLASIRQAQMDPAKRQQAVRDALEWYREQRKAVLDGAEPAATP
jgi:hypothetical protein